ncbi:hypothetical protein ABH992_004417 [Bradyrhizobium yuanmingense]|uniref:Uncharacterized protein n=1 Tax=Bradyrhizobium yuanmingense TaxID=108015 RepID=A0ABV4GJA8_9BRAD
MRSMVSRSDRNCACRALLSVPCMPASSSIAGVTDLALHDLAVVQHGEAKGQPFQIMANDLVAHERHQVVPVEPRVGQC